MPELVFHLDTSIDESERLSDIIERAAGAATAEGGSS
jgi:ribosome-binding factor A